MLSTWFLRSFILISSIAGISSYQQYPLGDESSLKYGIVDVTTLLLSLPAMLNTQGLKNLALATQVFLESNLNMNPTTVLDLQVSIVSQSLDGRYEIGQLHNSTKFVLSASMQIYVKYQLSVEDPNLMDMDGRIRRLFAEEWDELLSLLRLLDSSYFAFLHTIELKPHVIWPNGSTVENPRPISQAPTSFVILICIVVGIGIAISLMILAPLCLVKARNRQRNARNHTMSTSETAFGDAPHSSKLVGVSESQSSEVPSDSRGYIQRIYSDDKLNRTLTGLRVSKVYAEDKLKQSLSGIRRSLADKDIFTPKRDYYITNIPRVSTSSTDHASDLESQKGELKSWKQKKEEPGSSPSPPRKQESRKSKRRGRTKDYLQPVTNDIYQPSSKDSFRPVVVIPNGKLESDGCSISTMTGGCFSVDTEDVELEVLSAGPTRVSNTNQKVSPRHLSSVGEDFGSIAKSLPTVSSGGVHSKDTL